MRAALLTGSGRQGSALHRWLATTRALAVQC